MTNLESMVDEKTEARRREAIEEIDLQTVFADIYKTISTAEFREKITSLHEKFGGVYYAGYGKLKVSKTAESMLEIPLDVDSSGTPNGQIMLVLKKYDDKNRPVLSAKKFEDWRQPGDGFEQSLPIYKSYDVVEDRGRFFVEKSLFGFKRKIDFEQFFSRKAHIHKETIKDSFEAAVNLLVEHSKGNVAKTEQKLRTCDTYGIPCVYALSDFAPVPCFGNIVQCDDWRDKYERETGTK